MGDLEKAREILHSFNFQDDEYDETHREGAIIAVAQALSQVRQEERERCINVLLAMSEDEKERSKSHRGHLASISAGYYDALVDGMQAIREAK